MATTPQSQPVQQKSYGFLWKIGRSLLIWFLISTAIKHFTGGGSPGGDSFLNPKAPIDSPMSSRIQINQDQDEYSSINILRPLFRKNEKMNLRVFLSEKPEIDPKIDLDSLVWHEKGIFWNDDDSNQRSTQFVYYPSEFIQNNNTLYAHIYLSSIRGTLYERRSMVSYLPKLAIRTQKNLVTGEIENVTYIPQMPRTIQAPSWLSNMLDSETENTDEHNLDPKYEILEETPMEIASFFRPNLTLSVVSEYAPMKWSQLPPQMKQDVKIHPKHLKYYPILYVNDFWVLREHLIPLNSSVNNITISLDYGTIGKWKWQMFIAIDQSFNMQASMGLSDTSVVDELKKILLDSNPIYLGVTITVSLLHSVFEFLTMKNDVQFWAGNKSMRGLSLQSIFLGLVSQLIIFLYLLDEDTSMMIIIPAGLGILVECWKVTKAANVKIDGKWLGFIPKVSIVEKDEYIASGTSKYDKKAMQYLSYGLYPVVIGYGIYTLYYDVHKSWYSWLLKTATSLVYMLGFIRMVPQVWINYELKSVAHLPWRVLTYRFLTTIIDDLWAFLVTMPTLHRIACFRDDIIFVIYMYQRWAYTDRRERESVND